MVKEEQIYQYFKTKLQSITIANGYSTDIGSHFREWIGTEFIDEDDLTEIMELRDLSEFYEDTGIATAMASYEIIIGAKKGRDTASFLRLAKDDLIAVISELVADIKENVDSVFAIKSIDIDKDINYENKIYGDISAKITFVYQSEGKEF